MRNAFVIGYRWFCCKIPIAFKFRQMWWKSAGSSLTTRLNSLSRSRKIILALLVCLILLYYMVPRLLGFQRSGTIQGSSACMSDSIYKFQGAIDRFDALLNHVPPVAGESNFPAYVGNGYIAVALKSQNGLYIRLNRALSLPVKFYPIVETNMEGVSKEEVTVLHMKTGVAHLFQTFNTPGRCVTAGTRLYAHRARPSVLVQEISIHNPTNKVVQVDMDQVKASGWTDSTMTSGSFMIGQGELISYTLHSGIVKVEESQYVAALSVATITISNKQLEVAAGGTASSRILTVVQYTSAGHEADVKKEIPNLEIKVKKDLDEVVKIEASALQKQHEEVWGKLWQSGVGISYSRAAGAINGDKINSTMYYVLSNVQAPLQDPLLPSERRLELMKTLHYPDKCYNEHTSLHSNTLWIDPVDEETIARIVTTWILTLDKQGCSSMIKAGIEGVLQAMMLSIGSLHFGNDHLEMRLEPKHLHRDFQFHRLNYGNNTHLNISITVGEDNKASMFVALDRNDKPYYACDAGCLDPPVQLSKDAKQFPVKLTEPLTAILYITADKIHMEEYKHAIHVREIAEAPAHEHHVIALHKHGHHFGGLPTIFWISIAFLVVVFHLFLFKLIYNEYCQAQERFTRSRYNV